MGMFPGIPLFLANSIFPPSSALSLFQQRLEEQVPNWQDLLNLAASSTTDTLTPLADGLLKIVSPGRAGAHNSGVAISDDQPGSSGQSAEKAPGIYAHILAESPVRKLTYSACSPTRNRYGRVYVSGRPLIMKDRLKIVELHKKGYKKINIAKELGVTHSCVSKVLRRYLETGSCEAKNVKTKRKRTPDADAAEAKPETAPKRVLRSFTIENLLSTETLHIVYTSK
ncbi:unnamed protein product, partial [Mesorhabditis spiculigera]